MNTHEVTTRHCLSLIAVKEDGSYAVRLATTHPDRAAGEEHVGDVLSKEALEQIAEAINSDSVAGTAGSYRSVSLYHDWVHANDPKLDEVAFVQRGSAQVVALEDGHYAVEARIQLNEHYRGSVPLDEIKYRIEHGSIGGMSIEFIPDVKSIRKVSVAGKAYRFVGRIAEYCGQALARARLIANPHAIIYKEVESVIKEEPPVSDSVVEPVIESSPEQEQTTASPTPEPAGAAVVSPPAHEELVVPSDGIASSAVSDPVTAAPPEPVAVKEAAAVDSLTEVKELVAELKEALAPVAENLIHVKSKSYKTKDTENSMENPITISVKEANAILARGPEAFSASLVEFKEYGRRFMEQAGFSDRLRTTGVQFGDLRGITVKCSGSGIAVLGAIETKDVLDTTTNAGTYTQTNVEFNDVFTPLLVSTFNQQTNYLGAIRKVDHVEGGINYGWRIITNQGTSFAVDPDNNTAVATTVRKLKLQTPIKVYRASVEVSDFTLFHSRAALGDLLMRDAENTMRDMLKQLNRDLFAEIADGTNNSVLGLEAVADSAGNTTLYGFTRSAANRLAPDTATDTYQAIGGAISSAKVREAMRKVEIQGVARSSLRILVNPKQRDALFELEDANLRYDGARADFGFRQMAVPSYDGVPMLVDPDCPEDSLFVVDTESDVLVMSKAPQMRGLAKVGASEKVYVETYLAHVYLEPRKIHMLDTLS